MTPKFSSLWKLGQLCSALRSHAKLCLIACLVTPFALQAQPIYVDATFLSDPYADQDTSAIFSGSSSFTGGSLLLIYKYEDLQINPESSFIADFTSSVACPSGDCEAEIWVESSVDELHILLTREGGFQPFIYGQIVLLRGIEIVVEDLHRVRSPQASSVYLYPNPSTGSVNLTTSGTDAIESLEFYDLSGRRVYVKPLGMSEAKISLNQLSPGRYWVRLSVAGKVHSFQHQIQ